MPSNVLTLRRLGRRNSVNAHVWAQCFGDYDRAVFLLIVLDDGDPGAPYGQSRAIQRMHKIAFAAACGLKTDARATRLKRFAIRTGGNFAKFVCRGQPDFYVIGFCGGKAHVSSAEQHRSIVQAKFLKNCFGIANESLVLLVTFFRMGKFEKLNFLELMLAENAARVFPGGACFGAETSGPGGEQI